MAQVSRILVLGADVAAINKSLDQIYTLSGDSCTFLNNGKECVHELQLKTKYYTAQVEFHVHQIIDNELTTTLNHDIEEYEALIWVIHSPSTSSFYHAHHFLEKSLEELEFDVSLLVGMEADETSDQHLTTLKEWSLNHAFEFVPTSSKVSNQIEIDDTHETIGMHRVLEALHCNMWRSMVMVDSNTTDSDSKTDLVLIPSNQATNDVAALENKTEDVLEQDKLQQAMAALTAEVVENVEEDDKDMQAFDDLVAQVKRIRNTGKNLSDAERRRQAEQVAMQLWNMLGGSDDEESKF